MATFELLIVTFDDKTYANSEVVVASTYKEACAIRAAAEAANRGWHEDFVQDDETREAGMARMRAWAEECRADAAKWDRLLAPTRAAVASDLDIDY